MAKIKPKDSTKVRISHSISGFSLIPDYEHKNKYYATINRAGKKSKELPYNTLHDVENMVKREVNRGNTVTIRDGKRTLVLKLKKE